MISASHSGNSSFYFPLRTDCLLASSKACVDGFFKLRTWLWKIIVLLPINFISERFLSCWNVCSGFFCLLVGVFGFVCFYLNLTSSDIVDIKPANMEDLTEVITAAEFHPNQCNTFVYSSSKGTIRLCDMRAAALCDSHAKRKSVSFCVSVALWLCVSSKIDGGLSLSLSV